MNIDYKRKVSYFSEPEFKYYNFYHGHPMKPYRNYLTDSLVKEYDMMKDFHSVTSAKDWNNRSSHIFNEDLFTLITQFHADDYVNALKDYDYRLRKYSEFCLEYNTCEDCPDFPGKWGYIETYTKGTLLATSSVLKKDVEIGINYSGGLHHAKTRYSSGFCWINDCTIAVIEMLKVHDRVLYIDVDCHHGDGVEEAFYTNNRVMTLSIHKYGSFFPGSGHINDTGFGEGKGFSVNFPLNNGIGDMQYLHYYTKIIDRIFETFDPNVVLYQSGTDSISGDRLGVINLSIAGHGSLLEYVLRKRTPVVVIGGGGYLMSNVARAWCNETAVCLGKKLDNEIPKNDIYKDYFAPSYELLIPPIDSIDYNDYNDLDKKLEQFHNNIKGVTTNTVARSSFLENECEKNMIDYDDKEQQDNYQDKQKDQTPKDTESKFDYYRSKNYFLDLMQAKSLDEFLGDGFCGEAMCD